MEKNLKSIIIALDDGHGTDTAGKETPAFSDGRKMKENEFNAATAGYLKEALERNGFSVLMVAPEEKDTPLQTRVQRANKANAAVYISIHANAYGTAWNDANGIETIIYEKVMGDSDTYRIAKGIHDELIRECGRRNRGIKRRGDLYVLEATKMHAVLVECGFMTNPEEGKLLLDEGYRRKCAEAICRGVCGFYGAAYKKKALAPGERMQEEADIPDYGQELISDMVRLNCFGDERNMNLSEDMLRTMVLMDRYRKAREAEK